MDKALAQGLAIAALLGALAGLLSHAASLTAWPAYAAGTAALLIAGASWQRLDRRQRRKAHH